MASTLPFEKLVKFQMKRFKECNHKFKPAKITEEEITKSHSHNYALVSEIQCLVSNLLQFVKIIKQATSISEDSLSKRERKVEDLLAGLMQNMDDMKGRLSQYQEKVCMPRLHAKQLHLQKQQDEMAYILDCLCKGNTEGLTRFTIESSDAIKSRIENLTTTGKDIGILQGEVTHLTSDVNDIVDVVKDLITTVTTNGVSPRSSEIGVFMRRMVDTYDTSSTLPCAVELAEDLKGEVTQSSPMHAERRSLPTKLVSESSLGSSAVSNDGTVSPPATIDPPRVQCSDSAVNQKVQLGTPNSAFTPTAKKGASPVGHTPTQPEANFKNQLDVVALSRTSGSGEQAFINGQSTEGSREQDGRKSFAFGDSPVSFVTALQGGAISSIEEEEMAHDTFVKTVVGAETPNSPVADANSQTWAPEILTQGCPVTAEQQNLMVYSVLTNLTQTMPEEMKKAMNTQIEAEQGNTQSEMAAENEDVELSRIVPEENQEVRTPKNTPSHTEQGDNLRTTEGETKSSTTLEETKDRELTSDGDKPESEEMKTSSKTQVDTEDRKSSTCVTETQQTEKSEGGAEKTSKEQEKRDDSEACPTPASLSPPPSVRPSPHAKSRRLSETNTENGSMTSVVSADGPVENASSYSTQGDLEVISAVTKERIKGIQNIIDIRDMRELQRLGVRSSAMPRSFPRYRPRRVRSTGISRSFLVGLTIFTVVTTVLICLHMSIEANLLPEFDSFEHFLSNIIQIGPQVKALY